MNPSNALPHPRGVAADLRRHPIKGFTPEAVQQALLSAGAGWPDDRLYAVETGDSGFDPAAPAHVSKSRFAVLANTAAVARVRTAYDPLSRRLRARAPGVADFDAALDVETGRAAFADWLSQALGEDAPPGRLRMLAGEGWRFFDAQDGRVSLVNLASVRDLAARVGVALDPLRFRANLYVEGWPAWAELDLAEGASVQAGAARLRAGRPIRRCAAVDVNPDTAARDQNLVAALHDAYGHMFCGLYLQVEASGLLARGDVVEVRA